MNNRKREALKRIRRVAALDLDEPIRTRQRQPDPYAYQISKTLDYAFAG